MTWEKNRLDPTQIFTARNDFATLARRLVDVCFSGLSEVLASRASISCLMIPRFVFFGSQIVQKDSETLWTVFLEPKWERNADTNLKLFRHLEFLTIHYHFFSLFRYFFCFNWKSKDSQNSTSFSFRNSCLNSLWVERVLYLTFFQDIFQRSWVLLKPLEIRWKLSV